MSEARELVEQHNRIGRRSEPHRRADAIDLGQPARSVERRGDEIGDEIVALLAQQDQ